MRTVILVPRREGFRDRDALWGWCRMWWQDQLPEYPIYEGHHDHGLFNRSAAVNTAARLAGDWDVALIIDSDVFCDPTRVREAVRMAAETNQMVVPFEVRHNLSKRGSQTVMGGYRGTWKSLIERSFTDQHSAVIAVPRTLFDAVGGFDEGFRGWGFEDTAFAIAAEAYSRAKLHHIPGELWHLWHATAPEGKHGSPSSNLNRARIALYKNHEGDLPTLRSYVEEGRSLAQARDTDTIPRIIHRTVSRETSAEVERYWDRWQELHPGWRMLTHRDPLPPEEWPLTSAMWPKAKAGAQLADLIRLEAVYRWGGFYVDSDMEPFRSLEPLTQHTLVAAWEDSRCIPNAFLGAVPDHPAIAKCLALCLERVPRGDIWRAGPGVTTEVLRADETALLLPPESVYPVHYRDPDRDRLMADFRPGDHPWTFMLHRYHGSWLRPGV